MRHRIPNWLLVIGLAALSLQFQLAAQFARVPNQQQSPPSNSYPTAQPNQPYPNGNPGGPYSSDTGVPDQEDLALDQQHAAARISIAQGDVNIRRGDTGELVAAAQNAPLMAQDHLQTSSGSRAEIQLDAATILRVGPDSDLGFSNAAYLNYQTQLGAGTVLLRVLGASQTQLEIDTPSIAARAAGPGEYRISVLPDGNTQITVRDGALDIFSPAGSQRITANQSVLVRGDPSNPESQNTYLPNRDQFDDWSETRDRELIAARSYQYVSPDIAGAQDLDAYGSWVSSQYGPAWAPQVPADWSPYSSGEWAWENYYGWTWVDTAPWGWAPYHYGRWFWNGGRGWCWWPGPVHTSSLWRPALVGFFGWGGGLGWVPLAPYETFHGWWGRGYWRDASGWHGGYGSRLGQYGFIRNAEVTRLYRNAAFQGGAHISGYDRFSGPGQHFGYATRAQLASASRFYGGVPVTPSRASFQFSNRTAYANPRLSYTATRQFYHVGAPRPATVYGNGQRTPAVDQRAYRAPVQSTTQQRNGSGWQRFGAPDRGQSFTGNSADNGWHSFGQPQSGRNSFSTPSRPWSGSQPNTQGYRSWTAPSRPQQAAPSYGLREGGSSGGSFRYNGGTGAPRFSSPAPRSEGQHNFSPGRSYQGGHSDAGNRGNGGGSHGSSGAGRSGGGGGGRHGH